MFFDFTIVNYCGYELLLLFTGTVGCGGDVGLAGGGVGWGGGGGGGG